MDMSTFRQLVINFSTGDSNMYEKSHFGSPCATVNLPNEEYVDQLICAE